MTADNSKCLICQRIELIKKGANPCFICELKSGYVVFGDHQFYQGYTLLLSKIHAQELHHLPANIKRSFMLEMSVVAEAVFAVFKPRKLNYELLGNQDSHMHWHLYPRHSSDPDLSRPIWTFPKEKRCNESTKISEDFIEEYKFAMVKQIEKLNIKVVKGK